MSQNPVAAILSARRAQSLGNLELSTSLFESVLNKFQELPENVVPVFLEVAEELVNAETHFDVNGMEIEARVALMKAVGKRPNKFGLVANFIYYERHAFFDTMALEETNELNKVNREEFGYFLELVLRCNPDVKNCQRALQMAFAEYHAKNNPKKIKALGPDLLRRLEGYENLQTPELICILALANLHPIELLTEELKLQLTKFLVKQATPPDDFRPLEKCPPVFNNSFIAWSLCLEVHSKNKVIECEDELEEDSAFFRKIDICYILEQINFSVFDTKIDNKNLFLEMINEAYPSFLTALLNENPDRFLVFANQSQLEAFYKKRESKIVVDRAHIKVVNKVTPLPEETVVLLDELETMFEKINFVNPQDKELYCPPSSIIDDGQSISPKNALNALKLLIQRIKGQEDYVGVPKSSGEKAIYYHKLELYLQHIILILNKGPVAAVLPIKQLGTNGGGFFGMNSAHPFENPSAWTNFLECFGMMLFPFALVLMYGRMLGRPRHAAIIFIVMMVMMVGTIVWTIEYDTLRPNPGLVAHTDSKTFQIPIAGAPGGKKAFTFPTVAGLPVDQHLGNLEGKEMRFGTSAGATFAAMTVDVTCGAVNCEHDSLNPIAALSTMWGMWVNCIYGGKGVGMINLTAVPDRRRVHRRADGGPVA